MPETKQAAMLASIEAAVRKGQDAHGVVFIQYLHSVKVRSCT
jgi:hypothetical protein